MKKILVVDDDLDILELVQMVLKRNNFDVKSTPKWEEVDENISVFQPDLILLDVTLIGADGRDICKRLKQEGHTRHIPVVLFSANTQVAKNFHDCRADAFIEKPFELAHFIKTMKLHAG